jgi:DNA polymerase
VQNVAIDFESYYDDELTVKRFGNLNYLANTNAYLVAVVGEGWEWAGDPRAFDWNRLDDTRVWAHNAAFDGAYFLTRDLPIPGHEFNCSANLSAWLGSPRSLDKAASFLLGSEISKETRKAMKGRQWHTLSTEEKEAVTAYALSDARTARKIVSKYANSWAADEPALSQHTIEMGWTGIAVDSEKLARYKQRAIEIQTAAVPEIPWAVDAAGSPVSTQQAQRYCAKIGIQPPLSFAEKNEHFILWEAQHSSRIPFVAAVSRFRKATTLLRRLEAIERRLQANGRIAYELKYFGAHTGRWAGAGGLNLQNLRKKDFHGIAVRTVFIPEPGKKLIIVDLAQIEPRVLAWLCGDTAMLDLVKAGYSFYEAQARSWGWWDGAPRTLKLSEPEIYEAVKRMALGAGYGLGSRRFQAVVLEQLGIRMTLEEAHRQLNEYRIRNPKVVRYWNRLDTQLQRSIGDGEFHIALPSGRELIYRHLHRRGRDVYATFASSEGYRENKLWGGFLTENAVSATARDIFAFLLLRLTAAGLRVVLHCHDEYVIEADPDVTVDDVRELLRTPPEWCADLPLDSDGWEGPFYAKH